MNYAVKRRLRLSKGEACRTFLAPLLTIFATIGAASESAPAQTAFTLPAPPFELPLVPSVSGNWTAMIGVGGEYAPPLDNAETIRLTGPSRIIDENFSASTGDPARNEKLHGAITDLIARSLPSTLSDMHLADVL